MPTGRIYQRLLRPPAQSFFLFGMRGVGKGTGARGRSTRRGQKGMLGACGERS
jgi:hypothetical protein